LTAFLAGATFAFNSFLVGGNFSIFMGKRPHFSAILLLIAIFLSACTGMPVQEMSDARQALEAARKAGAETRAPGELESAEQLLQDAEKALVDGDYGKAKDSAKAAKDQAVTAQEKSQVE
jgi:hypothetical protein